MSKPESITIDDVKYIRADSVNQNAPTMDWMKTAKQEFLASILKKGEIYAGIIIGEA